MLGFLRSMPGRMIAFTMLALMLVVGFTHSAEAGVRCRKHHKHPVLKFLGRALLVLMCFGLAFASAAPALAGGGLLHRSVVSQRIVVRQPRVQRVVVQQQIVAQPVVVQQLYAPLAVQQLVVPQQFYVPSQQILQQRIVAPGCQAFFAR